MRGKKKRSKARRALSLSPSLPRDSRLTLCSSSLPPLALFSPAKKKKMAFAVASPARLAARPTTASAPRRGSAVVVRASASEPVDRRAVLGAGLAGKRLRETIRPPHHRVDGGVEFFFFLASRSEMKIGFAPVLSLLLLSLLA